MTDIAVATEDLLYCGKEEARLYAVEGLLISKARDIRFYDAYYALLSRHLSYWIEYHIHELDRKIVGDLLSLVRKTENFRVFLDREENKFMRILRDEIIPLGCVLYQMFSGSNKDKAFSEAKALLQYRSSKTELTADLPKAAQSLSKRKLERLWAKYAEVLHYVWLASLNQWRLVAGVEPVSYGQGRENWGQMVSAFEAVSPTKQIRVPEPIFLNFMTTKEFGDQLREIPPHK